MSLPPAGSPSWDQCVTKDLWSTDVWNPRPRGPGRGALGSRPQSTTTEKTSDDPRAGERTLRGMPAVASRVERFAGFSDEAIQFLLELQAEQSRTWFKAHQDDFLRLLRQPLERFIEELRERLVDVYPGMVEAE